MSTTKDANRGPGKARGKLLGPGASLVAGPKAPESFYKYRITLINSTPTAPRRAQRQWFSGKIHRCHSATLDGPRVRFAADALHVSVNYLLVVDFPLFMHSTYHVF